MPLKAYRCSNLRKTFVVAPALWCVHTPSRRRHDCKGEGVLKRKRSKSQKTNVPGKRILEPQDQCRKLHQPGGLMEPPGGRTKHYYYYGLPQVTVDGQRPLRLRSDDTCGSAPPLNQQRKHRHRERSSCFFFSSHPLSPKSLYLRIVFPDMGTVRLSWASKCASLAWTLTRVPSSRSSQCRAI